MASPGGGSHRATHANSCFCTGCAGVGIDPIRSAMQIRPRNGSASDPCVHSPHPADHGSPCWRRLSSWLLHQPRADRLQARLSPGSRSDLSGTPPQSRSVILAFREVRRMLQACYESSNRIEAAPTSGLTTPPRRHSDDADPHPTWASVKVRDQYHRGPFHCKSAPTIQLIP